jgi:hypothetical protein
MRLPNPCGAITRILLIATLFRAASGQSDISRCASWRPQRRRLPQPTERPVATICHRGSAAQPFTVSGAVVSTNRRDSLIAPQLELLERRRCVSDILAVAVTLVAMVTG